MKTILFSLFIVGGLIACSKTDSPAPITPPTQITPPTPITPPTTDFTNCRVTGSSIAGRTYIYNYNNDSYIESAVYTVSNGPGGGSTNFQYKNGLLVGITDGSTEEVYEYKSGVLTTIKIVLTDERHFRDYQIDIETDANKKIIKMTDSFGVINEIKRDSKGNVTEIKNFKGKDEQYRLVISEYDDNKSRLGLFKGWQFDVQMYYGDYMTPQRLVNNLFGCANNATKIQKYAGSSLVGESTHTIEYSTGGYPTLISDSEDRNNRYKISFRYSGCN